MTEQAQVKRGPGRPRKVRDTQTSPVPLAEVKPLVDEQTGMRVDPPSPSQDIDSDYVLKAPSKFVIDIRSAILANLDTEARARIVVCNEIKIVCKTIDAKGRTVNHSRHDAEWLKDYV